MKQLILATGNPVSMSDFLGRFSSEYDARTVSSSGEAIDAIEAHAADIILLDSDLPGLDPIKLLHNIAQGNTALHPPLILLSESESIDLAVAFIRNGGADYARKPINPLILSAKIARAIVASEQLHQQIRERAEAERRLEHSRESLAEAERIAQLGHWDWSIVDNTLEWSDEIYRIFGLEPQAFAATYDAFLNTVHPEDRDLVSSSVANAIEKRAPYEIDHRIVLPDGETRIVHEVGRVYYDDADNPTRMIGAVQDVTEMRRQSQELTKAKETAEKALAEVKQLEGLLPICCYCKKIRDDHQNWQQLEQYISEHSSTQFSHGVCPECYEKLKKGL